MKHGVEENKSLFGFSGKSPPFLNKDPLAFEIFPDKTNVGWGRLLTLWSSALCEVSLGGGRGGCGFFRTVNTAEGLTGTGLKGTWVLKKYSSGRSFIFSRLEAVVVVVVELELELSVSVFELSVSPSSSSCRSQVRVSISWTTWWQAGEMSLWQLRSGLINVCDNLAWDWEITISAASEKKTRLWEKTQQLDLPYEFNLEFSNCCFRNQLIYNFK